jgi:hypothetical protein
MNRLKAILLVSCFACALGGAAPAAAQMTRADSAAVLLGVAQQLRVEGRISLANSLLDIIAQRYSETPAAAEAAQLRLTLRSVPEERSGRTELLVWSTSYGLALGALVPVALGTDSPESIGVGLLAGGPLGYLLGRGILQGRGISEGQARAISFGTLWGAWQAYGWAEIANVGEREFCDPVVGCFDDGGGEEDKLRVAILGSLVGMGTGLLLARKEISAGTAATVSFGAFWGSWYGLGLYVLVGEEEGDGDRGLAYTLLGGDLGLVITALGAPKWQLSRGRARLISISGLAGLVAGFGILLITSPDDVGNEAILVPLATSTLGLGLGVGWTRNYDERRGQDGGADLGSAVQWRNGQLRLAIPEAGLQLLERKGRLEPALRIPVFKAVF